MVTVVLGDKRPAERDEKVMVYEAIAIYGVPNPIETIQSGFITKIEGFFYNKHMNDEFAVSVDDNFIAAHPEKKMITFALEYKGAELTESEIEEAIHIALTK